MGGLVSLQHLDVSHNSLHHLTPHLSCLVQLTHLEASDNKLHQSAAVPEELASLTALRVRASQGRGCTTARVALPALLNRVSL
jgi:Leucine-rich repeat (LRR) protein